MRIIIYRQKRRLRCSENPIYFGLPIAQRDNGLGVMFFDNLICRPELENTLAQTASVRFRRQPWAERVAAAMLNG
jgi:hypothetical protein